MLTFIAYLSGILGIIASIIEILQFLKVLNTKHKVLILIIAFVTSMTCFGLWYTIDTRNENRRIELLKESLMKKDAKTTADAIIISGWEESGDYLGYLAQITGFYSRHKEHFQVEYETYNRQLKSWSSFFETSRNSGKYYQGYSSELSELKGLVKSGLDNLEKISEESR